jgi:hypothetical protein
MYRTALHRTAPRRTALHRLHGSDEQHSSHNVSLMRIHVDLTCVVCEPLSDISCTSVFQVGAANRTGDGRAKDYKTPNIDTLAREGEEPFTLLGHSYHGPWATPLVIIFLLSTGTTLFLFVQQFSSSLHPTHTRASLPVCARVCTNYIRRYHAGLVLRESSLLAHENKPVVVTVSTLPLLPRLPSMHTLVICDGLTATSV